MGKRSERYRPLHKTKITPNKVRKLMYPSMTWEEIREASYRDECYGLLYSFYFASYPNACITYKHFPDMKSVLDFGAGLGASTIKLKQLYNNEVVYYDISKEYAAMAMKLKKIFMENNTNGKIAISDIPIFTSFDALSKRYKNFDLCCCWEVLEHVDAPLELLSKIVKVFRPKLFSISASFRLKALGHLGIYKVDGEEVQKGQMYCKVRKWFASNNYERQKIKVWNSRPRFYVKT